MDTIATEDRYLAPLANKTPLAFERGEGVWVWDEQGRRYLDMTAGWGVTCLGHAHPVITDALTAQSGKMIQNPNSGATYAPARARLLPLLQGLLPPNLTRLFFANSGAEANDAAIKLARLASGRTTVISTEMSFHGRTISTASATGQVSHNKRFRPLMPGYRFVPFGDSAILKQSLDADTAAVIVEPIQGEGGVRIPPDGYLQEVSNLCRANGSLLILDEIQTGFWRTGPAFVACGLDLQPDLLTMAKGIAGGFPFAAFAMTEAVAGKLQPGDHGGTYVGNPLGCAVSRAVLSHLLELDIATHVEALGTWTRARLKELQQQFPDAIRDVRGKGLLIAVELRDKDLGAAVEQTALEQGLILNRKHGVILRLFPALTITREEMEQGLQILEQVLSEYHR